MKTKPFIALFVLALSTWNAAVGQEYAVVKTSTRITIDPTKTKYTVTIDTGEGFDYLKDDNGKDLRSEARMLLYMDRKAWELVAVAPETTTGGNLSYTKYIFKKE